ncbi:MAG TPA: hypothetical protein VIJ14_00390 [Rhabdochlamydiaceae bacterium]
MPLKERTSFVGRAKEFSEAATALAAKEKALAEAKEAALQKAEDELVDSSDTLKMFRAIIHAVKAIFS